MGAVHGVYLKYVGLSAVSYAGYTVCVGGFGPVGIEPLPSTGGDILATTMIGERSTLIPLLRLGASSILKYSALLNGTVAVLFKLRRGKMKPPVKDDDNKTAPTKKVPVPVASEVQPGLWVGGVYSDRLGKEWAGVVDATSEFPERCRGSTKRYLCLPTWDGVPACPEDLEKAAEFIVEARENWNQLAKEGKVEGEPHILVHCAHGRGRSTTIMCAAMVRLGLYSNYEEALEKGIRPVRPVCKLNKMMRTSLSEWQRIYVEGSK
ncbi:hypothetical protein THAOC_15960 [Thalassiosira oceanica]|uniref:Tyrosine specific protein phosphatases domain-containing protein n=1 Tax=Thalassiosira oceanica TaxID=159749 RepID=K0SQQ0_THAOC|nr:hypothetical protein THAOC_15960 [Thalassiosira oceanica]|eukprot:EJK63381.1 hypothetical protein THAOC_15960 [Thalassiosira oceanica]